MKEGCSVYNNRSTGVSSTLTLESPYLLSNLLVFNYLKTNNSYVLPCGPLKILTTLLIHIHNIQFSDYFTKGASFLVDERSITFFSLR